MTNSKRFIESIALTTLLTLITSCSGKSSVDDKQDSDHIKTTTLADSILNQAHSQAKDPYFMEKNDHIFCGIEQSIIIAYRKNAKNVLTQFEQRAKTDSMKYANALIRDAHLFNNMEDFNKKYNCENYEHSTDHIYINYCRYRRSVAKLNTLKKYSHMKSK